MKLSILFCALDTSSTFNWGARKIKTVQEFDGSKCKTNSSSSSLIPCEMRGNNK